MSGHLSRRSRSPGGVARGDPAAYLDLAEPGRRSCLALHRAGFAWPPRRRDAGALLPHHFTFACTRLTCGRAIGRVFLWHCPAGFPGWALPTASLCGVRTFLEGFLSPAVAQPAQEGYPPSGLAQTLRIRPCGRRRPHGRGRGPRWCESAPWPRSRAEDGCGRIRGRSASPSPPRRSGRRRSRRQRHRRRA